ncbi:hypothetical protein GCM10010844_30110 [Deinococcus radiotolerans]|uniref:Uncharacterized protein n=1 Tax=Deinococcus radiotolerans TaxID=1309407 RepID=A0ABQ2FMA1_9DEIO|nr:hypothetical protein GCM10010844_30110 [Deinococcus radiotolerans]
MNAGRPGETSTSTSTGTASTPNSAALLTRASTYNPQSTTYDPQRNKQAEAALPHMSANQNEERVPRGAGLSAAS